MAVGDASDGLAAYVLSVQILLTLYKKGVFSKLEIKEIVEQCLLNLETQQAGSGPELSDIYRRSREPLEQLRAALSQL